MSLPETPAQKDAAVKNTAPKKRTHPEKRAAPEEEGEEEAAPNTQTMAQSLIKKAAAQKQAANNLPPRLGGWKYKSPPPSLGRKSLDEKYAWVLTETIEKLKLLPKENPDDPDPPLVFTTHSTDTIYLVQAGKAAFASKHPGSPPPSSNPASSSQSADKKPPRRSKRNTSPVPGSAYDIHGICVAGYKLELSADQPICVRVAEGKEARLLVGFELLTAEVRDLLIVREVIEWDEEAEGHVGMVSREVDEEEDVTDAVMDEFRAEEAERVRVAAEEKRARLEREEAEEEEERMRLEQEEEAESSSESEEEEFSSEEEEDAEDNEG